MIGHTLMRIHTIQMGVEAMQSLILIHISVAGLRSIPLDPMIWQVSR
jgi:hypothetical protein